MIEFHMFTFRCSGHATIKESAFYTTMTIQLNVVVCIFFCVNEVFEGWLSRICNVSGHLWVGPRSHDFLHRQFPVRVAVDDVVEPLAHQRVEVEHRVRRLDHLPTHLRPGEDRSFRVGEDDVGLSSEAVVPHFHPRGVVEAEISTLANPLAACTKPAAWALACCLLSPLRRLW